MKKDATEGLRKDGKDSRGRQLWRARIVARHPDTGDKVVDTVRRFPCATFVDAQKEKERLRDELLAKKLGYWRSVQPMTMTDVRANWLETITRAGTRGTWGSYATVICRSFGDRLAHTITTEQLQSYLAKLPGSKSRRVGFRTVLIQMFDWAIDHGHARNPNPALATRLKHKKDAARVAAELETPTKRHLTTDELPGFMAALKEHDALLYPVFALMLSIGCRAGEAVALKRSDVDWQTGKITIRRALSRGEIGPPKANKARMAKVSGSVLELLRGHVAEMDRLRWPGHEEWMFPGRPMARKRVYPMWSYLAMYRAVKAAQEATGVEIANALHCFRHTTASLVKGSVEDSIMRAAMGWTTDSMQDRYGVAQVVPFDAVERAMAGGNIGGNGKPGNARETGE